MRGKRILKKNERRGGRGECERKSNIKKNERRGGRGECESNGYERKDKKMSQKSYNFFIYYIQSFLKIS